ncbi:gaba permease, partial [Verticillium dahliae]
SRWTTGWAFFVGLLQGGFTMIGYGMVALICEEVPNPRREVPKGLVLSVLAMGITGLVYLIPILFVLPDVSLLLSVANGQPIDLLFKTVNGSVAGGFDLLFLLLGILLFAGVGAITAASRITYAFACDKAIPGHHIWSRVDRRLGVPIWSLRLTDAVNALLVCIYFGSSAAINGITGVRAVSLSTSYGLPVFPREVRPLYQHDLYHMERLLDGHFLHARGPASGCIDDELSQRCVRRLCRCKFAVVSCVRSAALPRPAPAGGRSVIVTLSFRQEHSYRFFLFSNF